MLKILLVEDDAALGEALHAVLLANQFQVTWVKTADAAKRFLSDEVFDLHLFDIVLPGESGLELLKWCQAQVLQAPTMLLTARDGVSDRVIGLDSGADDYLGKPFAIEEFLSRVRVLLRRQTSQKSAIWKVGGLVIDTARHQVSLNEQIIPVAKREYAMLLMLASSPGRVLTRAQLAKGTDSAALFDSNAVDVHIFNLRRKLGSTYISTIRGVGYCLDRPV